MIDFFNTVLYPIKLGEAWVMYAWHWLFDAIGLPTGVAWALSIVGLTVVVRMLLIPLFVKQIHSSRRMQLIQPEMQKIQKKFKGKRDPESQKAQQAEMMDLYRRTGTNPFSSCLPILIQSPFFFALFQLLNNLRGQAEGIKEGIGPITNEVAQRIEGSTVFGARLSDAFLSSPDLNVKIFSGVLIVMMSATTFTTQYQLMRKNMPAASLDNPFAKQQKVLLYLMPFFFLISGINFPIGVLIYWLTTNLWTMGQQFYVIRNMPAPGSAAEQAQRDRMKRKGKTMKELVLPGLASSTDVADDAIDDDSPKSGQRQQPKGKKRAKTQPKGGLATGAPGTSGAGSATDGSPHADADVTGAATLTPAPSAKNSGSASAPGQSNASSAARTVTGDVPKKTRQNPNAGRAKKPAKNRPGSPQR